VAKRNIPELLRTLNPNLRLLLLAAHPGEPKAAEVASSVAQIDDWAALLAAAAQHGVRPLLHRALQAISFAGVPPEWRASLEENVRLLVKQNLAFANELLHVLAILDRAGIKAIPYKGPITAVQAYRDIGLREFMDLDVMVRQRDIPRVTEILRSSGYPAQSIAETENPSPVEAHEKIPGQYHFARPPVYLPLEFHTEQTMRYYPVPLDLDRLSSRLVKITLGDSEIRVFALEDSLTILSVHGSKHLWNRIQWIADIAWLTALPDFNFSEGLGTARQLHVEKMTLTGLALASALLDSRLPPDLAREIEANRDVQQLAFESAHELLDANRARANVAERAAFRVRSAPTRREGIKHLLRLATSPTEEDRADSSNSELSSTLKRPLRLAKKYGIAKRSAKLDDLAPFVSTPVPVIDAMLDLAAPQPGDILCDPGCGKGAIVLRAAQRHRIRAVGIDTDSALLAGARKQAQKLGLVNLVQFLEQDAKSADFSSASIVTLFLSVSGNLLLLPRLRAQLKPGARVVSARFDLPGWQHETTRMIEIPGEKPWKLFLWRVK
jgi:precorrin-6B methylase 2